MTDRCLVKIESQQLSAEIDPLGAQFFSLRDQTGRDLQWNGDPAVWKGRAPILFPIVGALAGNRYRLDGKEFNLTRHGFARERMFALLDATSSSVLLRLNWDGETFAVYPFQFQLDMHFRVSGATLRVLASVRNLEDTSTMPASFGFHPALRWPLQEGEPREAHFLQFETGEPASVRRLDSQGLLAPETHDSPVENRKLKLSDDLFENDAVIFDKLSSRRVSYGAERGPRLEIEYYGMPYLGVWTRPGAGFICIEPWHGLADSQGFSGDFRTKPGMALIPPGTTQEFAMAISLAA